MGYTAFTTDLRTNNVLADISMSQVRFTDVLNEPGDLSGAFFNGDSDIPMELLRSATRPARTALWVDFDGELAWGGIIWKRKYDRATGKVSLECSDFLSFFARARIAESIRFEQVDQFEIVRSLIREYQNRPGGNIGIDLGSGGSGVLRDRTYEGTEKKQILEAIQQLGNVNDGFDFAIKARYRPDGTPGKYLHLSHPTSGRTRQNTDLVLDFPGNVSDYTLPEEGDRMITTVYARGEGSGTAAPSVTVTNNNLILAGYPRLEDEIAFSSVSELATLDGHARSTLAGYSAPVSLPVFKIPAGGVMRHVDGVPVHATEDIPSVTRYGPGDVWSVRVTDEFGWYPKTASGGPGLETYLRLVQRSVSVDPSGDSASVDLTMSPILGQA